MSVERHYQDVKSRVIVRDLDFEPTKITDPVVSNVFGRVFSFLVLKALNGFRSLCGTESGCIVSMNSSDLYEPQGYSRFSTGAGWVTINAPYETNWVRLYSDGNTMLFQFVYTDGTSSPVLFIDQEDHFAIMTDRLIAQFKHQSGGAGAKGTIVYNRKIGG